MKIPITTLQSHEFTSFKNPRRVLALPIQLSVLLSVFTLKCRLSVLLLRIQAAWAALGPCPQQSIPGRLPAGSWTDGACRPSGRWQYLQGHSAHSLKNSSHKPLLRGDPPGGLPVKTAHLEGHVSEPRPQKEKPGGHDPSSRAQLLLIPHRKLFTESL